MISRRAAASVVLGTQAFAALACQGTKDPGNPEPAKAIRQRLRVGMNLVEVCEAVAAVPKLGDACLIGWECTGPSETVAIDHTEAGLELYRHNFGKEETITKLQTQAERDQAFAEIASRCRTVKVGAGYYDVLLTLDATGRVRQISPVVRYGNRNSPIE